MNRGRRIPRGPLSLADVLLMNAFERSELLSSVQDPVGRVAREIEPVVAPIRRKKSKYGKALSKELKALNKAARTKSGKLRKGMTQAKLLKKAHRNVKRAMKGGRK